MKKNKITEFEGRGTFTGPTSMSVALGAAADRRI